MRPVGPIIKKHIEDNGLKKGEVANIVGITYNYLSTIFNKSSIDADLLEKICVAIKLHPAVFFETTPEMQLKQFPDITASTFVGNAAVQIGGSLTEKLLEEKERLIREKDKLLEEKERMIQILLKASGPNP